MSRFKESDFEPLLPSVGGMTSEWLLGADEVHRISKVERPYERNRHLRDWRRHVAARGTEREDPRVRTLIAGRYRDAWYGDVSVDEQLGKLIMRFSATPALEGGMEHWRAGTYLVRWRDRALNADAFATFCLGPDGDARGISMESVSPLTDWSFDFTDLRLRRVPAP